MTQLNCSVFSCANNQDNQCCLESIQIEGKNAPVADKTCCFSYSPSVDTLNPLREFVNAEKPTTVVCKAEHCLFNQQEACNAHEITIDGQQNTRHCTQTRCRSFQAL